MQLLKTEEELQGVSQVLQEVFGEEGVDGMVANMIDQSPKREKNVFYYAYDEVERKYIGALALLDVAVFYLL